MTLIEALVPAAIQKRTGLWESQEQDLWAHLMRMLQIQGFTDHNSYDVSCAAAILHKLGLHITDPYQKKRLLHVLHFLYLPNVSVITLDNLDLDITHRKTLRELLEVQPAFWGFISLFESAHYRLQQCLVERNVEALQKYIVSYSILHEKYGDINSAEVPLLKRLLEEDSLGYQLWGLNRDYENVVHQCLKDGWYQGLLVLVSAATSTSPFIGQCPHFNQRDRFGDAPIHLAARSINLLAVSRLLQVPAVDVTATDRGGKNVLHLLFLRIQIRWNRFRPGAGASAHREAAGTPRLEPGEHEVVEVAEQVLEKAESAPDLLLQEDKTGLSVLDYALGLRSNRLLLVLLHRIDHNTSTQYLDTAHRMQLLIGLLRSAVLLNQYDLVYTLARLVLKLNQNLLLRLAATPVKGGSPLKTRVPDGVVKEETLVDLVLLCLQEGLATSLQALVSVTPVGEGDPTFASCINRRGTETGTWLSSGRGGTEDTRAVRIVNCGYPQQYPLQLAVRRAAMHDMSTAGVSTKVGKAGDDPLGLPGNAGAAVVFAVSMVRTLIRAGAKVLVVLPQLRDEENHADNFFALAAQGGNVELQRVLELAAEQEVPISSVAASSRAPQRHLRVMAAKGRRQHGFFLEHLQATSNPLVHAVMYRRMHMARYLLDRSAFRVLVDAAETLTLSVPHLIGEDCRHIATTNAHVRAQARKEQDGDPSWYGLTPLAAACAVGSVELIDLLLERGASKDRHVWRLGSDSSGKGPRGGENAEPGNNFAVVEGEVAAMRAALERIYSQWGGEEGGHSSTSSSSRPITDRYSSIMRSLHDLVASAQAATARAHHLRESLLMLRQEDMSSLLQAACNENTPSVRKVVVTLIIVLKTSRIFPHPIGSSNTGATDKVMMDQRRGRGGRRGSTFNISTSAVHREWSKLLFGEPSLVTGLEALTRTLQGLIHDTYVERNARRAIHFPVASLQRKVNEGLQFFADTKQRYQWKLHIKDKRFHALLKLLEAWLKFVDDACSLLLSPSSSLEMSGQGLEGGDHGALLEAARPHIALYRAHAAFDRKLSAFCLSSNTALPVHFLLRARPSHYNGYAHAWPQHLDPRLSDAVTRLLPSSHTPSSRYNYQLKWWWDLVVVSANYNRESMARLTQITGDWFSHDTDSGRGKSLLAPAAALAVQAQNSSLAGASGIDWTLVKNNAASIMRHERDVQLLVSTLARVGGNPAQGVYGALVRNGFTMGAHQPSGWTDVTPLLHAIRSVDSDAFVALLLSSVTLCQETEEALTGDTIAEKKGRKGRKSVLKRLAKERKRRDKEIVRHTAAFWDRLRLELTHSLRCTSFTSFVSPLFGLRPSPANARIHDNHVARDSLEERAGVIAEVIELARQTSLDLLDGVHATPDAVDLVADAERLVECEGPSSSTSTDRSMKGRGANNAPVVWRRISLCNTNYCEVLSSPVLIVSRSGKKKVKPGRSFLYDVRGTASDFDFLSSFVLCRDQGNGAVTSLDVAGKPIPGELLQWADKAGNDSLLGPLLQKCSPSLWDTQPLTGTLLLLPRGPHDTTRALHVPLVSNIVAHGHHATVRTLLRATGRDMLEWGSDLRVPLAAVAANTTNVASIGLTLNGDGDGDGDGVGYGNGNAADRGDEMPRRGFTRAVNQALRPHLSAPSSKGLEVHVQGLMRCLRASCENESYAAGTIFTALTEVSASPSIRGGKPLAAVLAFMKATHALVNLNEPLGDLAGLEEEDPKTPEIASNCRGLDSEKMKVEELESANAMQLEENHNPNDPQRRHLSWLRGRREVVRALFACCKIEHEGSLLNFHRRLMDKPLDVCYSLCTRAKRLLKSLVHEKPQSARRWKGIVVGDNALVTSHGLDGSVASLRFEQWLLSVGALVSTPEECDAMLGLVDGLERNLLHNVSHDLEELLALGHHLQGSLSPSETASASRGSPSAASVGAYEEEESTADTFLGEPLCWLSRAESMVQRHFAAERITTDLARFEALIQAHVKELVVYLYPKRSDEQHSPALWLAAPVIPLLAFSSADLQSAVLGADAASSEGRDRCDDALSSCCKLLRPVLETVSGAILPTSVSEPFMAPDEGGGTFLPRLVATLHRVCGKEVRQSQRDAMEAVVRNLEAAVVQDIHPVLEALDKFLERDRLDTRPSRSMMNVDTCSRRQYQLVRLKVCVHVSAVARAVLTSRPVLLAQKSGTAASPFGISTGASLAAKAPANLRGADASIFAVLLQAVRSGHLNSLRVVLAAMCRRVEPLAAPSPSHLPLVLREGAAQGSVRIFSSLYAAFLHGKGYSIAELRHLFSKGGSRHPLGQQDGGGTFAEMTGAPLPRAGTPGRASGSTREWVSWGTLHAAITGWTSVGMAERRALPPSLWSVGVVDWRQRRRVASMLDEHGEALSAEEDEDEDEYEDEDEMGATSKRVDKEHLAVSRRALVAALLDRSDRMWRHQAESPEPDLESKEESKSTAPSATTTTTTWIHLAALALPSLALPVDRGTAGPTFVPFSSLDLLAATGNWLMVMRVLRMRSVVDDDDMRSGSDSSSGSAFPGMLSEGDSAVLEELALHRPHSGPGVTSSAPCFPFLHAAALAARKDVVGFLRRYVSLKAATTAGVDISPHAPPAGKVQGPGAQEGTGAKSTTEDKVPSSAEGQALSFSPPRPTPPAPPQLHSPQVPHVSSFPFSEPTRLSARASLDFLCSLLSSTRTFSRKCGGPSGPGNGTDKKQKKRSRFASSATYSVTVEATLSQLPGVSSDGDSSASSAKEESGKIVFYNHSVLHDAMLSGDEDVVLAWISLWRSVQEACEHAGLHDVNKPSDSTLYTRALLQYAVYFGYRRVVLRLLAGDLGPFVSLQIGSLLERNMRLQRHHTNVALPFPRLDMHVWSPLQLTTYCCRNISSAKSGDEGSTISLLLSHLPWPTQSSTHLIEAPEVADFARELSICLSLAVRVGNDVAAAALLRHMLARPGGRAAYCTEKLWPGLFGEDASLDPEVESLMAARTPEDSHTFLLLTACRQGMGAFLGELFQLEERRRNEEGRNEKECPEPGENEELSLQSQGRTQIRAFYSMLVEEAMGRGHPQVAELVLRRLRSMRLSPDPHLLLAGDSDDDGNEEECNACVVKAGNRALLALTLSPVADMLPARLLKAHKALRHRNMRIGQVVEGADQRWVEGVEHSSAGQQGHAQDGRASGESGEGEGAPAGGHRRVVLVRGVRIKHPRSAPPPGEGK